MVSRLPNFHAFQANAAVAALKTAAAVYAQDLTNLEAKVKSGSGWRHVLESLEVMDDEVGRGYSLISHLNGVRCDTRKAT